METQTTTEKRVTCPSCQSKGKRVGPLTLNSLLKSVATESLGKKSESPEGCDTAAGCQTISAGTGWRFCNSQGCDVVYFSEECDATFKQSQLRVEVGVKETTGERPLCYCFGHSVASLKDELQAKGHSDALEDVRQKMKDPGCRCETENPSGSCCLGDVGRGIKIAQEELGMDDPDMQTPPPDKSPTGKGETIAQVGTLVSAIMASSCCWLPLVLLTVGVSGAGIASTLEAYRPLFMVVTFGFLGAAFYFTYRPRKAVAGEGHGCCSTNAAEPEDCCAPAPKSRFSMMTLNKAMLWGVTVMAVAFLFFPSYVGALIGSDGQSVTENMNQSVIKVEGMTCDGCAAIVAKAIRTAPRVLAVVVDYEKGEAVVGTEICCPVPQEEILTSLEQAGYHGTFTRFAEVAAAEKTPQAMAGIKSTPPVAVPNSDDDPLTETKFLIEGMSCEGCESSVTQAIESVPMVTSVEVDYLTRTAIVRTPACCLLSTDMVLSAVKKAGFRCQPVGTEFGPNQTEN